ncbi:MAG: hypothetical protein AABW41_04215 [Nanoarchaeota archaeon]
MTINYLQNRKDVPTKKPKHILLEKAREAGARSIEDLCMMTGFPMHAINAYCKRLGITLPTTIQTDVFVETSQNNRKFQNPEIVQYIREGLSLAKIADKFSLSRERIRQKIIENGQYHEWKHYRTLIKQKEQAQIITKNAFLKQVHSLISNSLESLCAQEGWAYQKTSEYFNSFCNSGPILSFGVVLSLLQRYENAIGNDQKLSLRQLREGLDIKYDATVSDILKRINLGPMNGSLKMVRITKETKESLKRALELPLTNQDLGYFLGIPDYVAKYTLRKLGRTAQPKQFIIHLGEHVNGLKLADPKYALTYRAASQIYEAKDLGFKKDEIIKLLSTSELVFDYAMLHERELSGSLVSILKTLQNNPSISEPYT